MRKINNFLIFFIILIFVLSLFLIASFYDLQISQFLADMTPNLYYSNNFYAVFFEIFGEAILFVLIGLSLAVIFWAIYYKIKKPIKFLPQTITVAACIGITYLCLIRIFNYIGNYLEFEFNYFISTILIILSIIFTFLYIFLLKDVKKNIIYKLFWVSCLIILVALFSNLTVQILKGEVWGRIRFRAMWFLDDYSYYTPWWQTNGQSLAYSLRFAELPDEAFRSFPSGHTTAVAITFCFWFLPLFFKNRISKRAKFWCYFLPIILTLIVGLSRIVAGAHFLTDILFAVLIVMIYIAIFVPYLMVLRKDLKPLRNRKTKYSI